MTETTQHAPPKLAFMETIRQDNWWLAPVATAVGLLIFIVYSTWAAFQGEYYEWGPYLSPMYSPLFTFKWWSLSPAFLVLWAPLGFRATCYYYRKAYYRAFFLLPPACAVAGRPHKYKGERALFIFQNLHRYFLYLALVFIVILSIDAIRAFFFADGIHIGIGTLVMVVNAVLLGAFTFGCNSLRHLVGGNVDCYSCVAFGHQRYKLWQIVSKFNANHMLLAWLSLYWVGLTDLYIRLVAMGVITDLRII